MDKVVIRVDPERRQWWKETMSRLLPDFEVLLWDEDTYSKDDIKYAIVWSPPRGGLAQLPNLECVLSVGAGVSHITEDPTYPTDVPIIRTVGAALRQRMCEYMALHVLRIHRRLPEIEAASARGEWANIVQPVAKDITVGLMGLGNLGAAVAGTLRHLGYRVKGLSRSGSPVNGVDAYRREEMDAFLEDVQILASILPGTNETENIISAGLLQRLPQGAWVINVGRGSQVCDDDLLAALDSGHLGGAVLDVFRVEPLPEGHPFWRHRKILITSHTASAIEPVIGGEIIANNLKAFHAGEDVPDLVDMERGY